jgi:osmoprotectant transport system ATP-binding protein
LPPQAEVDVRVEGLRKRYGEVTAVDGVDLEIRRGEFFTMLGPSGSGKTTTLRAIAGFEQPDEGRIELRGRDVSSLPPYARDVNTVFQDYALFPHMTVQENVEYGLRVKKVARAERRQRAAEALSLVQLDGYGARKPAQLSGGQRQRAGVARALAADPGVLLMDEPFSAVDPVVRERLQSEFLRLQESVRKTIVFVTHDIEEAVRIGDRIAVMSQGGHVEQFATPAELLGRPANRFVADFVGSDRGLKRLAVTGIDAADLERPPVVHVADGLAAARSALERTGARWAVVLDDEENLHGWLSIERAGGAGTVGSAARRMEAWVPAAASLKTAFATMLQMEAGWVAVLDGDRFLGVLTPESLHAALRRSVEGTVPEVAGAARV